MQVQIIKLNLYKYSTMELQIEGKLLQNLDVESGTSSRGEWKKQNFIIETVEQYPRKICIAAWTNSIPILDTFQPGEMVLVSVSIESREFNGKWYTDVRAWRVQPKEAEAAPPMPDMPPFGDEPSYAAPAQPMAEVDDLPF